MIELPKKAVSNAASGSIIDFGGFLRPPTGGRVMRIDRMGNRFKVAFSFPPFKGSELGRIVVSRLIRGKTEGIRMKMPLLDFAPGVPGTPVVDGAGQAGRTLNARGFAPYYAPREGQWFSHHHGDDVLLYNIDAGVKAGADGKVALPISPMMRVEPADGDELNFRRPMIQGYVHGQEWSWEMSLERNVGIEFEIEEMV